MGKRKRWWAESYGGAPGWLIAGSVAALTVTLGWAVVDRQAQQIAQANTTQRPIVTVEPITRPPSVVVIGDSYSYGLRATTPAAAWPRLFANSTGYGVTTLAVSGSGYTVEGPSEPGTYAARIPAATAADPDVIVFQGSINDLGAPNIGDAATAALTEARTAMPEARCVVIGPSYIPKEPAERIDALHAEIADAAQTAGCEYADARTWIPLDQFADPAHPNDAGYASLANRVRELLD